VVMGATDSELLGRAYEVTNANTALWQEVAQQRISTYPKWRKLFYGMTRPNDTTVLYQDALSLKQGKGQEVLDYISKKGEAFARAGISEGRLVIPLVIDGMVPTLAMEIRRIPPSQQPRSVAELQELAQNAESNWRLYAKAKGRGRDGRANLGMSLDDDEDRTPEKKTAMPARQARETDLKKLTKAIEEMSFTNLKRDPSKCLGACWKCGEIGHFRQDCPEWKEYLKTHPDEAQKTKKKVGRTRSKDKEAESEEESEVTPTKKRKPASTSSTASSSGKEAASESTHVTSGAKLAKSREESDLSEDGSSGEFE